MQKKTDVRCESKVKSISAKQIATYGQNKNIDMIHTLITKGELAKAAEQCREMLRLFPQEAEILHLAGVVAFERERYSDAIVSIKEAIELDPTIYYYHFNLANAYVGMNEFSNAANCYQQAILLQPDNAKSYWQVGNLLYKQKKYDQALDYFQQALSCQPDLAEVIYNIGLALEKLGRFDEAVSYYQQVIELMPNFVHAYNNLGALLMEQGELLTAQGYFEKGLAIAPDRVDLLNNIAKCFYSMGKRKEEIECYQRILAIDHNHRVAKVQLAVLQMVGTDYRILLQNFHRYLHPRGYLEIGVATGQTLTLAQSMTKCIGVDPAPRIRHDFTDYTEIFKLTSDEFFAKHDILSLLGQPQLDFAFIDGLHHFEQVLRDFINVERYAGSQTVVLIHDTLPTDEIAAGREHVSPYWVGDCWKIIPCLKKFRPDLCIYTLSCPPSGLTMVTNLDPSSQILTKHYTKAINEFGVFTYEDMVAERNKILNLVPGEWSEAERILKEQNLLPKHTPVAALNSDHHQGQNLFILGNYKTGTSSMVGMLNAHPDIFILYEVYLREGVTRYGKNFLKNFPDARYLFRRSGELAGLYSQLQQFLANKGHSYRFVGDKIPLVDSNKLQQVDNSLVIYCIRDIRTWLVKDAIIEFGQCKSDLTPVAIDYCVDFLQSFLLPAIYHCRLEDFLSNNDLIITKLASFLNLELRPHLDNWWKKIVVKEKGNPKGILQWWRKHPSSLTKPLKLDVSVSISSHPFWEAILPIFDKYYLNIEGLFSEAEILKDIAAVKSLWSYCPVDYTDAYMQVQYDRVTAN